MGGGSKKLTKKDKSLPYISYRNNSKSPNRSSRNAKKIIDGLHSSRSQGNISTKNEERSKEPAPIIINKDEHFQYKPPSLIHETVVNTLRKEKDNLTQALRNQREANQEMGDQVDQLNQRFDILEKENKKLLMI